MMTKRLALCAFFVTTSLALTQAAAAQGTGAVPANFPPADFTGAQFADARGCIFVRAGSAGSVTWVPRMTRQRKQICGQTPTFGRGASQTASASAPARGGSGGGSTGPTIITPDAPVAATSAPARRVASVAPAPRAATQILAPNRVTGSTTAVSAPQAIRAPSSKPASAALPRVVRRVPSAASANPYGTAAARTIGAPAITAPPITAPARTGGTLYGHTVSAPRAPSVGLSAGTSAGHSARANMHKPIGGYSNGGLAPNTRIVPRHVYEENRDTQSNFVPHGYRPAWEDDRLNPYRAVQTVQGHADTQAIWTNTVPRRLVSQEPQNVPFPQKLWTPRYKHEVTAPIVAYRAPEPYPAVGRSAYRHGYVSSSGTAQAPAPAAAQGRYVEIGVFSTDAKARAAASRLGAAGLAVRATPVTHNGQPMQRLRVGPFNSGTALGQALAAAHRSGYTQAYTR